MKQKNNLPIPQNSTIEVVVYKPTPAMTRWLCSAEKLGISASITQISKDSKVDRTNWYKWQEDSQFVEWWDQSWKRYIKLHRHKLDLIGFKKAETDHEWWRDMKKVVGQAIPPDVATPVSPFQNNTIINLSQDEINRITED